MSVAACPSLSGLLIRIYVLTSCYTPASTRETALFADWGGRWTTVAPAHSLLPEPGRTIPGFGRLYGLIRVVVNVVDYIEIFYNPKRKHTNNGMLSPVDFETRQQKLNEAGV